MLPKCYAPWLLDAGTGKTVTLVECALQLLRVADGDTGWGAAAAAPGAAGAPAGARGGRGGARRRVKLLLSAPQNYSADLIASSLAAALGERAGAGRLLRLNDPRRWGQGMRNGRKERRLAAAHVLVFLVGGARVQGARLSVECYQCKGWSANTDLLTQA